MSLLFVLAVGLLAVVLPGGALAAGNPTVTSVSPGSGTVLGGTSVTITGTEFAPGATVFFAGVSATSVVVESSTRLSVVTPRGTVGSANVLVRNADGGAVTVNSAYYYTSVSSDVTITGLSVMTGPSRGGTVLTVTGTGFSGSVVLFGGAPATNVTTLGPSSISLRTPPGLAGAVDVTVRNGDAASATLAKAFTYQAGGLELSSISPGGGVSAGGAVVRVGGYAFAPGTKLFFGDAEATNVVVVNPTLLTATTPSAAAGTVNLRVVTPDGQSATKANGFTFRTSAASSDVVISGLSPTSGAGVGGTSVTVSGTGFSGGATVFFGTAPALVTSAPGPSTIIVTSPPSTAGTIPVTVVNSDGTSATLSSGFRYEGGSGVTLTSMEPKLGSAAGGSVVAISGTGFVAGAMVSFNGVPASNVWVVGDSLVYATTPAGAGAANVVLTNPGGVTASLAGGFTYEGGSAPPPPPSSGATSPLPTRGFGLFVFAGGTNTQLVASAVCSASSLAFWATNAAGEFDTYVPAATIGAVNAAWNARFPNGVPANTALIGRCQ